VLDRGRIVARGTTAELKSMAGSDVLAVRLADPAAAAAAAEALADLAGGDPPHAEAGEVRLAVADPAAAAEAVRRLDARGLPLAGIELQRPTLDDVFLALTAHPTLEPA
jgi:ABC-type uncharacterized transport system ATPase subunit